MQLDFYNALKAKIQTLVGVGTVGLWNNQFSRDDVNVPVLYPCVFIEFLDWTYRDFLQGSQEYEGTTRLHLGFETYLTEDTSILQLKQDLHLLVHYFQQGYNTKMLRRNETQNFDHDNVQDYIIDYYVSGKDFTTNKLPTIDATITTLITTVDPQISNLVIRTDVPL